MLITVQIKRMIPCEYLRFLLSATEYEVSEQDATSITTIASEYVSDFFVGRMDLECSLSFGFVESRRSSGARQRVEPLPFGVEALTETFFVVIEENPKSVRRGLPSGSMRMLDCVSSSIRRKPK